VKFFAKKGIGSFVFIYPLYTGKMAENWQKIGIRIKEVVPYLKKSFDLIEAFDLDKELVFNIPPCCLPGYEERMVEFTPFYTKVSAPDVITESVDYDRVSEKMKFPRCQKCKYFEYCEGVWKNYVKIFGDKEFQPIYQNEISKQKN
jgi:MoaA/NifB/PqqE/SkfB family radical SAM enzyme